MRCHFGEIGLTRFVSLFGMRNSQRIVIEFVERCSLLNPLSLTHLIFPFYKFYNAYRPFVCCCSTILEESDINIINIIFILFNNTILEKN